MNDNQTTLSKEMIALICKIDLSTQERVTAFKAWQFNDGTLEGLEELYKSQHITEAHDADTTE